MKKVLVMFFWLSLFLVVLGKIDILSAKDKYTFAMLPQITQSKVTACWQPLLDYIQQNAGITIEFVFPKNFEEHVKLCAEGKVDFAYSNPITYIQMAVSGERKTGHIVIAEAKSKNGFFGQFIIRKDSEIKKFEDIKGKKGMIVGWDSAGGYVFQQAYAISKGFDLKKDCELSVTEDNKQEKVILNVISKKADFGCIRNGMLQKAIELPGISDIKVLAETPKYPEWLFSHYSELPKDIVEKVRKALLSIPEDLLKKAALPGEIIGFSTKKDKDLNAIREVAKKVGINY
ncbi:MAG TPA: phosphate/phosphite/phosphonate ABC transporter substrate-binding protein [bacterium]|nr:phosphate/phosphite/phosphonate ABC transporter substrate-binding protein [bacterium]